MHVQRENVNLRLPLAVPMDRQLHSAALTVCAYLRGVLACRRGVRVQPKILIAFIRYPVCCGAEMEPGNCLQMLQLERFERASLVYSKINHLKQTCSGLGDWRSNNF